MGLTLAYRPRPSALGSARPAVAALYLAPLAICAFAFSNPLVLGAAGAATLVVAAGASALAAVGASARYGAVLALMIVAVNALVSQRGETILVRGWELPVLGQIDISAEALAEGGVLALRILVVVAVFAVWSACVDPDRVVRAIRPFAARSALTATLISRMVPLAAADATRLTEASALRGPAAAPVGRVAIARRLIAGGLDRSVDVAATLELRGYGLEEPIRNQRSRPSAGEMLLVASGAATAIALACGLAVGVGGFEAYPSIAIDLDLETALLAVALPLLVALPLADRTHPVGGRRAH